jgi:hypothetical protein
VSDSLNSFWVTFSLNYYMNDLNVLNRTISLSRAGEAAIDDKDFAGDEAVMQN